MFDSYALTKVQTIFLVAVIIVASVGGGLAYFVLSSQDQPSDTIKIGVLADLDGFAGSLYWQSVVLAAEQLNAEGGILGKQVEVVGEDHDIETRLDMNLVKNALTRLLSFHNVDFVIGQIHDDAGFACQDTIFDHKKILMGIGGVSNELTQRVVDDYDKYKYFFRLNHNATSIFRGMTDSIVLMREVTGFNEIGYLALDSVTNAGITAGLDNLLPDVYGFDLVYQGFYPPGTLDFSSYFAAAEFAGVEVLVPLVWSSDAGISFVKEWHDRQSPMFVFGGALGGVLSPESWNWTGGKCDRVVTATFPVSTGYALTSKTLHFRDAFINRWGETPTGFAGFVYDAVRYILPDAVSRAGSIETDAVIEALEETSVETVSAQNFVFTSDHDLMFGENPVDPEADYILVLLFQWQNGEQVPVFPRKIMEAAGATYTYPDWPGPWD